MHPYTHCLKSTFFLIVSIFSGDIFENYCGNDDLATFGRFCFGISIITTFPLECFVTREVWRYLCTCHFIWHRTVCCGAVFIGFSAHHPVKIKSLFSLWCLQVVSNVFFKGSLNNHAHVAVTLLIVAACTALSLAYDCLGMVLVLNVSRMTFWIVVTYFSTKIAMVIFLTNVFFVFQGVVSATPLIFIIPSACYLKLSTERWFQGENRIPCLILIAGVFVMTTGLIMAVMFPQDCSHGAEMFYCATSNLSISPTPLTELLFQNSTQNSRWNVVITHWGFVIWLCMLIVFITSTMNVCVIIYATICESAIMQYIHQFVWQTETKFHCEFREKLPSRSLPHDVAVT